MSDFDALLRLLSVPRPCASAGEARAYAAIRQWLEQRGIAYQRQYFRLYPYSNELIGAWLLLCALGLPTSMLLHAPWWLLLVLAIAIGLVIATVITGRPLVTWPVATRGENILLRFGPTTATQELLICTHYDSKTELFDHVVQGQLLRRLPLAIGLTVIVLLLGLLANMLPLLWANWLWWLGFGLALVPAILVGLVGINLIPGRLIAQSQGAVDNGAACAIVLALAEALQHGGVELTHTLVTLALFGGEEVSMQGSQVYVRSRSWPLPSWVINLELLGQNGPYIVWGQDGNVLVHAPTSQEYNQVLVRLAQASGRMVLVGGGINSDGYSFLRAGIPTSVFGSHDRVHGGGGLHRPSDNLARVELARLPETVALLLRVVAWWDSSHRKGYDP